MGTLAEIVYHKRPEPPALLFEDVPGFPKGMRLLSGATNSSKRLAITLGLPVPKNPLDVVRAYRDRMKVHRPIPPKIVAKGAVLENIDRDDDVDLLEFPVPMLHEHDGGRYIGTDDLVIMRDPDDTGSMPPPTASWCRTRTRLALDVARQARPPDPREVFPRRQALPGADLMRHDPLLFLSGGNELNYGLSEFDYAGGHRGEPYDIVESELYGLPMPAEAEIVLEGEMVADREGRPVRRVHRLLCERRASSRRSRAARLPPQRSDPRLSPRRCGRRLTSRARNA